jgi:hypothetical protein
MPAELVGGDELDAEPPREDLGDRGFPDALGSADQDDAGAGQN